MIMSKPKISMREYLPYTMPSRDMYAGNEYIMAYTQNEYQLRYIFLLSDSFREIF
jgi:hypothetical protein